MTAAPVDAVYVHPAAAAHPRARRILDRLAGVPVTVTASPARETAGLDLRDRKRRLFLTRHRGRLLKPCPGTPGYLCCGYRVLNVMTGCPYDCSYCILQGYLNQPCVTVNVNLEDAVAEVAALVRTHPGRALRLGTGELADSLALDGLTGFSRDLVPRLLAHPEVHLELKTKSARVDGLLDLDHRGRVVAAWSVNAERIVREEEHGAPPLEARLRAAARCRRAGYRVALHFDPLVRHDGWRADYRRAVEAVFDHLPPASIAWISLGALRYPPALDAVIRRRFPESPLPLGELVPGLDGKLRYFRPLRTEMYRYVAGEIARRGPAVPVYLCMESPAVWEASLGRRPASSAAVARLLDETCPAVTGLRR